MNAERFTTPELKELEVKILEAEERSLAIEREIFETAPPAGFVARRAHQSHGRRDRRAGCRRRAGRSRRRKPLRSPAFL